MGLVVRRNYVWCLVIFVIFMGFGGKKRCKDVLKSSFGVAMQATIGEEGYFNKEEWGSHYVVLLH